MIFTSPETRHLHNSTCIAAPLKVLKAPNLLLSLSITCPKSNSTFLCALWNWTAIYLKDLLTLWNFHRFILTSSYMRPFGKYTSYQHSPNSSTQFPIPGWISLRTVYWPIIRKTICIATANVTTSGDVRDIAQMAITAAAPHVNDCTTVKMWKKWSTLFSCFLMRWLLTDFRPLSASNPANYPIKRWLNQTTKFTWQLLIRISLQLRLKTMNRYPIH